MKNDLEKIYFISGCIPYNGKSGGRVASYNHLHQICREYQEVHAFFVDMDDDYDCLLDLEYPENLRFKVYKRNCSKFDLFKLKSVIMMIFQILFSNLPRNVYVGLNKEIQENIKEILLKEEESLFVFDNIDSCGNIFNFSVMKYIYISHNNETKLSFDALKYIKFFLYPYYFINFMKMYFFERKILRNSKKNIFISDKDMVDLSVYGKCELYLEYLDVKDKLWKLNNTDKSIFFLGSANHFPNKEAVLWILRELSHNLEKIDSDIKINICGLSIEDISLSECVCKNIKFLGKLSDEELKNQFLRNRLFLSPVVLGSGVKIKILEAISYGMPVICTPESIEGLGYLENNINISSRKDFAANLVNVLENNDLLSSQSSALIEKIKYISNKPKNYFI